MFVKNVLGIKGFSRSASRLRQQADKENLQGVLPGRSEGLSNLLSSYVEAAFLELRDKIQGESKIIVLMFSFVLYLCLYLSI